MSIESLDGSSDKRRVVSVKDVAKAAGVSVASVSRAFNGQGSVSEATRKTVLEVAKSLGYAPNPAAKALRMQRSFMVGAVFPNTDYGLYARVLSSFQRTMSAAGYMSILLTVGFDNSRIYEPVSQLVDRGVEGLMVVGRIDDRRLLSYLLDKHIPVVSTYSALQDAPFPSVGVDNYAATAEVMNHLLGLGHRRFALISGPTQGNDRQQARRRAFQDALAKAGLDRGAPIIENPSAYSLQYVAEEFRKLMQQSPRVTAVVCNSDAYGMVVMLEAKRLGIRVPEDLSVTGFDDQEFAALLDPPLTTIAVPADDMGTKAARALLEALQHDRPGDSLTVATPLVVRSSTGPAGL